MKKIICTVTNDLTYDQRMIRICTSLANAGYAVTLVGRIKKHSKPLSNQLFDQRRFKLLFEKGKLFYIEYNFRLFLFLLCNRFDLVCAVDLDTIVPGLIVSGIKRKRIVYDAHEYFTEVPEVVRRLSVKSFWERLATFSIPKIKNAYTVCESLAEIFKIKYNTPFAVIRNVPTAKRPCNKRMHFSGKFVILYQGVLNEGRGLEEAILAMELLKGVELWLAGEGDLSERLRELTEERGLQNSVIFHGLVEPSKLHELTCQAHVGLNLLKDNGLSYYFSLANKTFDYIQAGIPALCMSFPEYEKLNQAFETFELLSELTPNEIAKSIDQLKSNKVYYYQKCENCKVAAKELIWEKEEQKLLAFYANIFK